MSTFAPRSARAYRSDHPVAVPYSSNTKRQSRGSLPVTVTNSCNEDIYPAILTQSGTGPAVGGFLLTSGSKRTMSVSEDWQGRLWGRTNCSFNSVGTSTPTGSGVACSTGDCGSVIDCKGAGENPATLAELTMDTGGGQTFYDISLVDGYNLPMAIVMHPNTNFTFAEIPPNLTNPSCVASVGNLAPPSYDPYGSGEFLGTNATHPLPFDTAVTSGQVSSWCPWALQVNPRSSPSNGVYTYPDGGIQRSAFNPCLSACAKYNTPEACCTGSYDSPSACTPTDYSRAAKGVCPDAYSYAFDDQTSTFIIPSGAGKGFEVIFCPGGRSTNILGTSKAELVQLAQDGIASLNSQRRSIHRPFDVPSRAIVSRAFVDSPMQSSASGRSRGIFTAWAKYALAVVLVVLLM